MAKLEASKSLPYVRSRWIAPTFVFVAASILVCSLYASAYGRGLFMDGVYFLYRVAERDGFYLVDPPRMSVHAMRQAPIVLLSKLTDWSLLERGRVFSFVMLMLPLLVCVVCWFVLPSDRRAWILFPVLHLLAGVGAMSFYPVGEAAIATSYFWILLFLLLFRSSRLGSQALFLLLCAPAFRLHEGAFPLMLVLLLVCAFRLKDARDGRERAFLVGAALFIGWIVAYQVAWVIEPRLPVQRARVLRGLYHGDFLLRDGHLNLPLVTGILAISALAGVFIVQLRCPDEVARSRSRFIALTFTLFACAATVTAWLVEQSFAPSAQALARYQPVFVSSVLGVAAALAIKMRVSERLWMQAPTFVIVVALCVAQSAADVAATSRWHDYTVDLQSRLASSAGLIPWQGTLTTGDEGRDMNWRLMSMEWVIPLMSIVFARQGVVTSMINPSPEMTFRPVDPERPDQLPKLRGVDFGPYQRSFSLRKSAGTPE